MNFFSKLSGFFLILFFSLQASAQTYSYKADDFSWETASTKITWDRKCTNYDDDDDKATITFTGGFQFPFGGVSYSSARVLSNGIVQFGPDVGFHRAFLNTGLPVTKAPGMQLFCSNEVPSAFLAVYWDDINPSTGGSVSWQQKGTAPNRYVVISWNDVPHYNAAKERYRFQVILYENGEFKYQYGAGNSSGTSATIGVQVSTTDYTQYSFNSSQSTDGTALRWFEAEISARPWFAEYRLDEDAWGMSWNGTAGEVFDATGGGRSGLSVGGATAANVVANRQVCGYGVIASNTKAGEVRGIDTTVNPAADMAPRGAISMWYRANAAWGASKSDTTLFDASTSSSARFGLIRNANGSLSFVLTDSAGSSLVSTTSNFNFNANTWVHVMVTWALSPGTNMSTVQIFVNGVLAKNTNGTTLGVLNPAIRTLLIGDNWGSTDFGLSYKSANGLVDQIHLYNSVVGNADVNYDYNYTHPCTPPVNHLEITGSASGIVCRENTLTIKACLDSAFPCSNPYTGGLSGYVAISGPSASWNGSTGGASGAGFVIPAGSSSITKGFWMGEGSGTITAISQTPPSLEPTRCSMGSVGSCSFTSAKSGLNIVQGETPAKGGKPTELQIQAIESSGSTPNAVCMPAANTTGTLKAWATSLSGGFAAISSSGTGAKSTNVGGSPSIGVSSSTQNKTLDSVQPTTATITPFALNASGIGSVWIKHMDTGNVRLNFLFEKTAQPTSSPALSLEGNRNVAFTPEGFGLNSSIDSSSSANTACSLSGPVCDASAAVEQARATAGDDFSSEIFAVLWSPLGNSDLTDNPRAPSFEGAVSLQPLLLAPNGGSAGGLTPTSVSLSAGAWAGNIKWNEVGAIKIRMSGLSDGVSIITNSALLGRFKAHDILTSSEAVSENFMSGVYMDAPLKVSSSFSARGKDGNVLANYVNGFAKLNLEKPTSWGLKAWASGFPNEADGNMTNRLSYATSSGVFINGIATGELNFVFASKSARAEVDGPFDVYFGFAPKDDDDVDVLIKNASKSGGVNNVVALGQKNVRFGIIRGRSVVGAETTGLRVPMEISYWNGSGWLKNENDSNLSIAKTSLSLTGLSGSLLTLSPWVSANPNFSGSVTANKGVLSFPLSAPGNGMAGGGQLTLDLTLYPWLRGVNSIANTFTMNSVRSRFYFGKTSSMGNTIYIRDSFR